MFIRISTCVFIPMILLSSSHACLAFQTEENQFRVHAINLESEFSAAGLLDVNSDGKADIVCGAWWYEAPLWKKHYFREVEKIRGRFDDYSNQVVDIDGDQALDIVSVNYRSQSLYWSRNPGKQLGEASTTEKAWENIVIDRPGTSETGRLVDIDGDGKLDILPAGTNYAAWYEFTSLDQKVQWHKHPLPDELIGHGIGAGDINGDGRLDIVGPNGWAEAPYDRRNGRWYWHGEFQLAKDCSLPILCWDVDHDGDNDLVWSRAHNVGLYWTEQINVDDRNMRIAASVDRKHPILDQISSKRWVTHAIDTSWSNIHALMTADMDGDGKVDLVAGKRFMAHDGKDTGEYDPLCIYWYKFDSATKTWARHTVSEGGKCGIDLDSVCADLDADGDIDIVAPSRTGLHWVENLRIDAKKSDGKAAQATRDEKKSTVDYASLYPNRLDLSYVIDESGQRKSMETPFDHCLRRSSIRKQMQQVMGKLPGSDQRVPLDVEVQSIEDAEKYSRIHLTYASDNDGGRIDRVPAYLLVPKELRGQAKAMLVLHQTHFELGKGEPCGLGGNPNLHIAHELAEQGFVCLAPDYPGFSEYRYDFEANQNLYASGTMKGIWNHLRAVDLLESLPCVKRDSIGVIGHSLGGHNSLFVAAFDLRIRSVVTSCGFNAFEDYYGGNLKGWTSPRYMPRIASLYQNSPKKMPFDFPEVLAAIAPRPLFVSAPRGDSNFAVVGVEKCEQSVRPIYDTIYKSNEQANFAYPDAGHDFPKDIRQQVYDWLK